MNEMVFDELHVVSDLHLGGEPGFQIFNQGDVLAATIRRLSAAESDRRIGLVLNGDIVDFLAERPAAYLDPQGAIDKLRRIFAVDTTNPKDLAFSNVWKALKEFVGRRNRLLVLVLGNHDVELALPHVQHWLSKKLSGNKDSARGRILYCTDGAGFRCRVGDKNVLCVHGNEVDNWNMVDHHQLLETARALNRGQPPASWDANAGTRMVIDIMNGIKRDFPMVDLLKPEVEAALPFVLTLDPGRVKEIGKLLRVVGYLSRDRIRRNMGFLSAEEEMSEGGEKMPAEEEMLGDFLSAHFSSASKYVDREESLLDSALDALQSDEEETDISDEEFLGPLDYIRSFFGSSNNRIERLREAFRDKLDEELGHEDTQYKDLAEEVSSEIHYLIAGHTHLERAITRAPGRYYYNSGTWIRLIELDEHTLDDPAAFKRVYEAFKAGDIAALDAINDLGPNGDKSLVLLRPTVVSVVHDGKRVMGELRHAAADGSLKPILNSRFPRS